MRNIGRKSFKISKEKHKLSDKILEKGNFMPLANVERDSETIIDHRLLNLGWRDHPNDILRTVWKQGVKTEEQRKRLGAKRPDYTLYPRNSNDPIAVIEAKKRGANIHDALTQGENYARRIDAPIVFATDGVFTKSLHLKFNKPLLLNNEELDDLIKESLALRYLNTNEVNTLDKRVIKSRGELISIFSKVNDLLREEGLQQGIERFSEFANILFLKVLSELETIKEENGEESSIDKAYRWETFRGMKGATLLNYVSDTVIKGFGNEYGDETVFQPLQIRHPDNLREIITLLDDLQLSDTNADIKGDAFEYFIRSYSASNPSDLGEIFTPRHIVKTMVKLLNPEIGETIYDPFCGTGGMLIVAYKHIYDSMTHTELNIDRLKKKTLFGTELTKTASIAKMNMILAGDGHSNIRRGDSFENPIDNIFDVVITNFPFAQNTRYGNKYGIPSRNGDHISPQHCFRALKEGGRMAIIAPEGFLVNTNSKEYGSVRKYLIDNSNLCSVISLPRGAFEPYNRTKVSILYFTDCHYKNQRKYYWYFNVKNDGYTLDKKRERIKGGNDLEIVLSERNLEKQTTEYLKSIDVQKVLFTNIKKNSYILSVNHYTESLNFNRDNSLSIRLGDLFEISGEDRIGQEQDAPVMSITMSDGLIDQKEKFKKRIASKDISKYRKVYKNELVVGFPIDEGVLGFQTKYQYAAVSPAYKIWKLKRNDFNIKVLEMILRSEPMRTLYKSKMQGSVDRRRSIPDDIFLDIILPFPSGDMENQILEAINEFRKAKKQTIEKNNVLTNKINRLFCE
jgi:type I restriction enzyme M protein